MKEFRNARYICPEIEIKWAYNPLPLYYRTYESPILGIEPAYNGCTFELVHGNTTIVPGISMFATPGHSPGHMSVTVATEAGDIVIAGDAIFQARNMEPNEEEKMAVLGSGAFREFDRGLEIRRGNRQEG